MLRAFISLENSNLHFISKIPGDRLNYNVHRFDHFNPFEFCLIFFFFQLYFLPVILYNNILYLTYDLNIECWMLYFIHHSLYIFDYYQLTDSLLLRKQKLFVLFFNICLSWSFLENIHGKSLFASSIYRKIKK